MSQLYQLLSNYFTPDKVDMYIECDDLLQSYGHTDHVDKINEVIQLPIMEDVFKLTPELDSIFVSSCHDILLKQFVVPAVGDFNMYFRLLKGLYQIENSFESTMILEVIEDNEQVATPSQTLSELLEAVCDIPWDFTQRSIQETRGTLIKLIKKVHTDNVEAELETYNVATVGEERLDWVRRYMRFWQNRGESLFLLKFIDKGLVSIPSTEEGILSTMTPVLSTINDPQIIAKELIGMASCLAIKVSSISTQAKRFNNMIYTGDAEKIMQNNLKIDAIMRQVSKEV